MSAETPLDFVPFVQRMVAQRRFVTEGDVVAEGLRLLQALEALSEKIGLGFEQLDAGLGVPAEDVYARAEYRIREIESQRAL